MQFMSYITRTDPETGLHEPHENKRKVFISYKHADEERLPLCHRLAEYILEKFDVAVWYDCQLTAGEAYDKEIKSAIESSDVFIWLLTPTVLTSRYIIEKEIPLAIGHQLAIIPIIAGLDEKMIPEVEKVVGSVHMPLWFQGEREDVPEFPYEKLEQLWGGLSLAIANKDLLSQAELFLARGGDKLSLRYLTPEQVFIKAYGCLFGVTALGDKSEGVKLMESILASYTADKDFEIFQKEVALELLCHFYRSDQPALFFTYLKLAIDKGLDGKMPDRISYLFFDGTTKYIKSIYEFLFLAYKESFHSEVLSYESELSFALFKACYHQNFGREFEKDELLSALDAAEPISLDRYQVLEEGKAVGVTVFDTHRAYLQRAQVDPHAVDLIVDGRRIATYDLYASFGDVYMIYLAYDREGDALLVLHSDFDHYGVECATTLQAFRLEGESIRCVTKYSDWLRGRRDLPYNPHTFGIRE